MICINNHHYKCKTAIILGRVAVSQELKPSQNEEESLGAGYATLPGIVLDNAVLRYDSKM